MADRRQVQLDVDAPDSGSVAADPDLLRRVMDNLIDNATRHSPAGTAVRLTGAPTVGGWSIEVRDQGPGIPKTARAARLPSVPPAISRQPRLTVIVARVTGWATLALSGHYNQQKGGALPRNLVAADTTENIKQRKHPC